MSQTAEPEPLSPSLLKVGVGMLAVGGVFLGYALTVEVFDPVPVFTFDSRLFRWSLFALGMVIFSIGVALTAAIIEARRNGISPPENES